MATLIERPTEPRDSHAMLRVHAHSVIPLSRVTAFLRALNEAYDSIYVAVTMMPIASRFEAELLRRQQQMDRAGKLEGATDVVADKLLSIEAPVTTPRFWWDVWKALRTAAKAGTKGQEEPGGPQMPSWADAVHSFPLARARRLISPGDQLVLKAVELHSPGSWEFVGRLLPFEVIRLAINDAHERRKDREYREAAEKRTLELENALRESRLLREQVELAKSIGAKEEDLQLLLRRFVLRPLSKISNNTKAAAIGDAEIETIEE